MTSIQNQAKKLVDTLMDTSDKTKAGIFPFKDLQLYVMNTVTLIAFGRTFPTRDDRTFIEISETIDEGFKLSGVDYDLANYLPVFTIYDYFKGVRKILSQYLIEKRNPVFGSLIKEAHYTDGPNLVKYLDDHGHGLSKEETMVIFCKLCIKKSALSSNMFRFHYISRFNRSRYRYKLGVFMLDYRHHVPPSRGSEKNSG